MKQLLLLHAVKMIVFVISDMFNDSQLFILFEFADCGKDLDSYEVRKLVIFSELMMLHNGRL